LGGNDRTLRSSTWTGFRLGARVRIQEGFDLTKQDLPGQCLFILVDPPYWNIIRYSDSPGDLSSCSDYEEFREMLMVCLKRCYDALVPGGRLAVLIGDVRRQGR
jgi:hypothetical protein